MDEMVEDLLNRRGEQALQEPLVPRENIDAVIEALIGGELSPEAVARKYNEVLVDGTQSFLWTKLVFIVQGRAGKTSLLNNLTNQPFEPNQEITDGADVCTISNNTWERLERMANTNFERGVAEAVGQSLKDSTARGLEKRTPACKMWAIITGILVIAGLVIGLELHAHQHSQTSDAGGQDEPDSPWQGLSHSVKVGVAYIGAILVLFVAAICAYQQRQASKKTKDNNAAGLIDLSQDVTVTANDIIQKMPLDLVVQVAKDGRQQEIIFHTWDFGGQQVYYVLHHIFITGGVYCLVFDMCEAQNKLQVCLRYLAFWLTSVHCHISAKDECSIILVGTHRDIVCSHEEHVAISDAIYSTFAHCSFWERLIQPNLVVGADRTLCFFPVDNNVGSTGVTPVLNAINAVAQEHVDARVERPLRWRKVLDQLLQMAETTDYLIVKDDKHAKVPPSAIKRCNSSSRWCDLWSITKANGITDPAEFEQLVQFFDSMGIFKRCYSIKKQYHDVIILRPQWLVNVFSAVISCCNLQHPADQAPSELAHDLYRFESKAILSVRLLRYLWTKKEVVTRHTNFDFLVGLMVRFDLMFELKNASGLADTNSRRFLVPAMLTDAEHHPYLPKTKSTRALECFFIFEEEQKKQTREQLVGEAARGQKAVIQGETKEEEEEEEEKEKEKEEETREAETKEEEEETETLQSYIYSASTSQGGRGGLLPSVIFTKLQAKCATWAQATSNIEPRLSSTHADVTFGAQQFELHLEQEACAIAVVLSVCHKPHVVVARLKQMINDVLESFPALTYEVNVRDQATGHFLPLERTQLEVATQRSLAGTVHLSKFRFNSLEYDCGQFDAWLPHRQLSNAVDNTRQLYDVYICAHASDRELVCRIMDCLTRQNDDLRIKCSRRVGVGEDSREVAGHSMLGKHTAVRQDMFSISRSAVFVPIISAAVLMQWRMLNDTAKSTCFRGISFSMAMLAVVDILTDLSFGLVMLHHQHYLYGTTVIVSLLLPFTLHTVSIWHIVQHEHRVPNLAFRQWLTDNRTIFPLVFFLGALRPDILNKLLKSQAFGWPLFRCPLSERSCTKLTASGFVTNLLHDLPQLCISVWLIIHSRVLLDIQHIATASATRYVYYDLQLL
jgi:GTPase SAR1 family protein